VQPEEAAKWSEAVKQWGPALTALLIPLTLIVNGIRKLVAGWLERRRAMVTAEKTSQWDQMCRLLAERDKRIEQLQEELTQERALREHERALRLEELTERAKRYDELREQMLVVTASLRESSTKPVQSVTSARNQQSETLPRLPGRLPPPPRIPRP
jgi:hypothetical protein